MLLVACVGCSFNTVYSQNKTVAEKIDGYIQAKLAKSSVPGLAVAVVHDDSILLSKGYGITGNGRVVTANSPFAIASLSKAFTAMAVMQLVETRQIELNAPVINYLPSFATDDARGATVTVQQLLHQTSGLADTGFPELSFTKQPTTLDEAVLRLKNAHLVSTPGQRFHYHNPNYQVLAKLVEAVSHEKFPDYLQKHIFRPLGMTTTQEVAVTKSFYKSDDFTKGHIYFLGKPIAFQEPDWFIEGSAGMASSINDMAHWLIPQMNHGRFGNTQLLDSTHTKMMQRPPSGAAHSYGMGWFLTANANLYHSGILWTYSAEQMIITKDRYGIVVLFNGGLNPFVDYYSFTQGIADILTNKEPEVPFLPDWFYAIFAGAILVASICLSIRRLLRLKHWQKNYAQRPLWRSWVYLLLRILPFILFLFIPLLITAISGRVLSWERIFLMLPEIMLGLGITALVNLMVVITRLVKVMRIMH